MIKTAKILVIGLIPLLLTGCFGGSTDTTTDTSLYKHSLFEVKVPQDWEVLEPSDFTSNVPRETLVAFRSNIKSDRFTANVNVIGINTEEKISSLDFAKSSESQIKTKIVSYEKVGLTENEIQKGENTVKGAILEFSGKKSATDPIIHFKQLYIVDNGTAYTITASYLPDEDITVVKYAGEVLTSFALK